VVAAVAVAVIRIVLFIIRFFSNRDIPTQWQRLPLWGLGNLI
jgi:hypothetical protein